MKNVREVRELKAISDYRNKDNLEADLARKKVS